MPRDYNERLCNRAYKRRVINRIIGDLPQLLKLTTDQELIIDYVDFPILYKKDSATNKLLEIPLCHIPPMGECDIKFTR
jgi:hypothetical protein